MGSPAAYVNAVIDALAHAGVRNIDMPVTSDKVWQALDGGRARGVSSNTDVLVEAGRLAGEGKAYALATVVRVVRPASARAGDRALVTAEGRLSGWIGGACAEPAVVLEASGRSRTADRGSSGSAAPARRVTCPRASSSRRRHARPKARWRC